MKQVFIGSTTNDSGRGTLYLPLFSPGIQGTADSVPVWNTTENYVSHPVPIGGTIRNLYVKLSTAPGAGENRTFTVMKNGSATSLSAAITGTNTIASDTTNTVTVSAGDTISLRHTASGNAAGYTLFEWSVEFEPSTDQRYVLCSAKASSPSPTSTRYQSIASAAQSWASPSESDVITLIPHGTTVNAIYVKLSTAPGGTDSWTFALRKNGSQVAGTSFTISGTATTGNITGLSVPLAAGDYITIEINPSGIPNDTAVGWGVLFTPDTNGESIMAGVTSDNLGTNTTEYCSLVTGYRVWSTTEGNFKEISGPTSWVLKNFRVRLTASPGIYTRTFRIRKNGANGNSVITITGEATTGVDNTNTDTVSQGDEINISHVASSGLVPSSDAAWCAVQFIEPAININVADTITIEENVAAENEKNINVSDTATIAENYPVGLSSNVDISDSIVITESIETTSVFGIDVSDTITTTEFISSEPEHNIIVFEDITITENTPVLSDVGDVNVFDSITTTEGIDIVEISDINLSDNITITELTAEEIISGIDVSDIVTITDVLETLLVNEPIVFEDITITESTLIEPSFNIDVADFITITEPVFLLSDVGDIDVSDIVTIEEGTNAVLTVDINTFDDITISEFIGVDNLSINVAEDIVITEDITPQLETDYILVSDDVSITELTEATFLFGASVADDVVITENVEVSLTKDINVTETISITESITTEKALFINRSDTITITESIDSALINPIDVFDSITITEALDNFLDTLNVIANEDITISELARLKSKAMWTMQPENAATWSNVSKNTSTWSNQIKNTSDWENQIKSYI